MLGASSSLAWRLTKRGWGLNAHAALVVLIAVTAGSGWPARSSACSPTVPPGWFSYVALACLVLTPVLVVLAAPWLLLGVGRRRVARDRRARNG